MFFKSAKQEILETLPQLLHQAKFSEEIQKNDLTQEGVKHLVLATDLLDQLNLTAEMEQLTCILQKLAKMQEDEIEMVVEAQAATPATTLSLILPSSDEYDVQIFGNMGGEIKMGQWFGTPQIEIDKMCKYLSSLHGIGRVEVIVPEKGVPGNRYIYTKGKLTGAASS